MFFVRFNLFPFHYTHGDNGAIRLYGGYNDRPMQTFNNSEMFVFKSRSCRDLIVLFYRYDHFNCYFASAINMRKLHTFNNRELFVLKNLEVVIYVL